ncbi:hypothetical protein Y032_0009g798 [Ancylostoma ceylanicum]|nr:hypothetical protein Y032_0009g798 [Ancylostoma ceylanicum]
MTNVDNIKTEMCCEYGTVSTVGVDGGDLSPASKSTLRDRAAYDQIVAAVANVGFLGSCSSHLISTNKKTH